VCLLTEHIELIQEDKKRREEFLLQECMKENTSKKEILKTLLLAVILTGFLGILHFTPLKYYIDFSNINFLKEELSSFHAFAPLIFLVSGSIIIALGAPRFIITVLGGMVFGFIVGTILSLAAAFLGSIVIFWITRLLGRPFFQQKFGSRLNSIEKYLRENGILVVVLIRQLPVPCMLGNILLGLTSVKNHVFILGSIIGLFPESAIFALYGSSVQGSFILKSTIASILLIIFVWAIGYYYRHSTMAKEIVQKFRKV
jgi:uncharacterized membrane protein YdjX (TVP38/TMEM64 family)